MPLEHNGLVYIPSNLSIDHAKALHGTTLYCSGTKDRLKGLEHIISIYKYYVLCPGLLICIYTLYIVGIDKRCIL